MRTDTSRIPKAHIYAVVFFVPGDPESKKVYSERAFQPFNVGDEISDFTFREPKRHEMPSTFPPTTYVVARVIREAASDEDEVLDTTWIFLADKPSK